MTIRVNGFFVGLVPLPAARCWDKDVTVRTSQVLRDTCTYMRILTRYLSIHTHTYTYSPCSSRACAMRSQAASFSSAFMTLMPADQCDQSLMAMITSGKGSETGRHLFHGVRQSPRLPSHQARTGEAARGYV